MEGVPGALARELSSLTHPLFARARLYVYVSARRCAWYSLDPGWVSVLTRYMAVMRVRCVTFMSQFGFLCPEGHAFSRKYIYRTYYRSGPLKGPHRASP